MARLRRQRDDSHAVTSREKSSQTRSGPGSPAGVVSIHAPRAGGDGTCSSRRSRSSVSIHAPRAGGDSMCWITSSSGRGFNPRRPRGRRPPPAAARPPGAPVSIHAPRAGGDVVFTLGSRAAERVSIHAPRAGGDGRPGWARRAVVSFQSTPPARAATSTSPAHSAGRPGFNPRPPRGRRHAAVHETLGVGVVSIHAPRAGGDRRAAQGALREGRRFNPRPPRGGRRHRAEPSAIRACFNPRPPRGGRRGDPSGSGGRRRSGVSIHAPRAGGDSMCWITSSSGRGFNPRPPRGRRRAHDGLPARPARVSIHAPRAGGDLPPGRTLQELAFQSTPPARGATRGCRKRTTLPSEFQSTPPARAATRAPAGHRSARGNEVSIHAPRAGGDHKQRMESFDEEEVSIHAPRAGGDDSDRGGYCGGGVSIHAPRAGGDAGTSEASGGASSFQSTPPARGATSGAGRASRAGRCRGFNPRPPRGGRPVALAAQDADVVVSIHAPRAGGDSIKVGTISLGFPVSIHAPRAGGDPQ